MTNAALHPIEMRGLLKSLGNFMGRINPSKLNAADDQQYIAAHGALDMLDALAGRVEKLEAVVAEVRAWDAMLAIPPSSGLAEALADLDGDGGG